MFSPFERNRVDSRHFLVAAPARPNRFSFKPEGPGGIVPFSEEQLTRYGGRNHAYNLILRQDALDRKQHNPLFDEPRPVVGERSRALEYLKSKKRAVEWRAESWFYVKTGEALMLGAIISILLGGGTSDAFSKYDFEISDFMLRAGSLGAFFLTVLMMGSFKARAARRAFNRANLKALRQDRCLMDDVY